jgi:BirA family transcriptional regulator, biotin operon repressor / biotin---[acetyl-CoA-carboxylase] ligase
MVGVMSTDDSETSPARIPLDPAALRASLIRPGGFWRDITVVETTGSTNADLTTRAAEGAPEGTALAAEEQLAGRGRMGRRWVSLPRSAVMVSVLFRPAAVPPSRRGWLPLLAGVAAATAVRQTTGVPAVLKWPNDVLVGERKLAGILAEQSGDAIVVGLGLNVSATEAELPDTGPGAPAATSLRREGATALDRNALLAALLAEFERRYRAWSQATPPGDPEASGLRRAYLEVCTTVGRDVRVERPAGQLITGRATGIDLDGRLVVEGPEGAEAVSAGDVRHLR